MEVSRIVCMGILIVISAIDIRYRKIPVGLLAAVNAGAFVYQCICGREDAVLIAGGIAIGTLFLVISRVTEEGIGYGDSLGILGLGIYVGLWKVIEILAGAFFLLAICAMIVLVRKRMSRKCSLPFYPFLLAGYILWMAGEIKV